MGSGQTPPPSFLFNTDFTWYSFFFFNQLLKIQLLKDRTLLKGEYYDLMLQLNYFELGSCAVLGRYWVCLYFSWKVKISWEPLWVPFSTLEHPDTLLGIHVSVQYTFNVPGVFTQKVNKDALTSYFLLFFSVFYSFFL